MVAAASCSGVRFGSVERQNPHYMESPEGLQLLPWTLQSPDMNPIEHDWEHLQKQLKSRVESRLSLIPCLHRYRPCMMHKAKLPETDLLVSAQFGAHVASQFV
ncbi:UNVERIFIED_CONTAM: hypothetical protein FKN15_032988 [Acipenser sinensis]